MKATNIVRFIKVCLTLIIVGFAPLISSAQSSTSNVTRLGIGDKVPDHFPLMNIVNYSKSNARMSDFKGKWLILDYWFTGCAPCIESWPKLMQLQEKYADKIQIILVNHMQNEDIVKSFITRKNKNSIESFSIPSVTGDTILHKILPASGYPSIVWIDPEGIYRASTNGSDLNDESIRNAIANSKSLKTLVAKSSNINLKKPLFIDGNGGSGKHMRWYSTISGYSNEIDGGYFLMSADSSGYLIAATNKPVLDLITRAYCVGPLKDNLGYIRLPRTRIELQVKDPSRLLSLNTNGHVINEHLFTYQLISYQPRTISQLKEIMVDDIQKYFGLDFKWMKIKKKCLVLRAIDTALLGDGKIEAAILGAKKDVDQIFIKDMHIPIFFGYLTEFIGGVYSDFNGYPLVDETGYTGGLDIEFENVNEMNYMQVFGDYQRLNKAMEKYKIRFVLETREVDALVVRDTNTGKM